MWKIPFVGSQQIRNKDIGYEKQMPEDENQKIRKSDRTREAEYVGIIWSGKVPLLLLTSGES